MLKVEKQTNWISGTERIVEVAFANKAYVKGGFMDQETLRDLAEAAAAAADALDLIAETKAEAE
jgi:hypothetical protein